MTATNGCKWTHEKRSLSKAAVQILKAWMFSEKHIENPYPSENEKHRLMEQTGLTKKQLTNWFTNSRKRLWQPVRNERAMGLYCKKRRLRKTTTAREDASLEDCKTFPCSPLFSCDQLQAAHVECEDRVLSPSSSSADLTHHPAAEMVVKMMMIDPSNSPATVNANRKCTNVSLGNNARMQQVPYSFAHLEVFAADPNKLDDDWCSDVGLQQFQTDCPPKNVFDVYPNDPMLMPCPSILDECG
jgi:hypothetical protein